MTGKYQPIWDLDSIFPGGSSSAELANHLDEVERKLANAEKRVAELKADPERWAAVVGELEEVHSWLWQAAAFIACLMAQDVRDRQALILQGRVQSLGAKLQSIHTLFDERIKKLTDEEFEAVAGHADNKAVSFFLHERRRQAVELMDTPRELLANALAVDGYHAWQTVYNTVVGRITVPFEGEELSVGQAANRFADLDREKRQQLFTLWEEAWSEAAEVISQALNHLAGFRLNLYEQRGWNDYLHEPLENNRVTRPILEAMWAAVESSKQKLKTYLDVKAKLIGADKLAWYDLDAPVGQSRMRISYDDAAEFVQEQFAKFSPEMAAFAQKAFENRWIEAEDRPHKRPGGFCTSFPLSHESRIFMTFSGTADGQSTLAHELGHAYHAHVLGKLRPYARLCPMTLAETASTFAELMVSSAAIEQATETEEKVALLGKRLDDAVAYLMNIHARYLFETRFYEQRSRGQLSVDELNDLMTTAQKEAYVDGLSCYHPLFWASKLHFYSTGQPFYNFPYTFGYLFSMALYARAREEGAEFERRYVALLEDTGRMSVADLAKKHLGADLTDPSFWQQGLVIVYKDLDDLLALTEATN